MYLLRRIVRLGTIVSRVGVQLERPREYCSVLPVATQYEAGKDLQHYYHVLFGSGKH